LAGVEASSKALSMPPLSFGERFEDAYEVVFVLDDREQLATQMSVISNFFLLRLLFFDETS
jgi:crossover junction endonuclease MUS81